MLFLSLYVLDFSYWPAGFGAWMRRLAVLAVLVTLFGGGLLTMSKFPYLPLAMAMLLMPFSAVFLARGHHGHGGSASLYVLPLQRLRLGRQPR